MKPINLESCLRIAILSAFATTSALIIVALSLPALGSLAKSQAVEFRDSLGLSAESIYLKLPDMLERRYDQLTSEQKEEFHKKLHSLLKKIESQKTP